MPCACFRSFCTACCPCFRCCCSKCCFEVQEPPREPSPPPSPPPPPAAPVPRAAPAPRAPPPAVLEMKMQTGQYSEYRKLTEENFMYKRANPPTCVELWTKDKIPPKKDLTVGDDKLRQYRRQLVQVVRAEAKVADTEFCMLFEVDVTVCPLMFGFERHYTTTRLYIWVCPGCSEIKAGWKETEVFGQTSAQEQECQKCRRQLVKGARRESCNLAHCGEAYLQITSKGTDGRPLTKWACIGSMCHPETQKPIFLSEQYSESELGEKEGLKWSPHVLKVYEDYFDQADNWPREGYPAAKPCFTCNNRVDYAYFDPTSLELNDQHQDESELQLRIWYHDEHGKFAAKKEQSDVWVNTYEAVQKLGASVRLGKRSQPANQDFSSPVFFPENPSELNPRPAPLGCCRQCKVRVIVKDKYDPNGVSVQRDLFLRLCKGEIWAGWNQHQLYKETSKTQLPGWERCTRCHELREESIRAAVEIKDRDVPPDPTMRLRGCGTYWLDVKWDDAGTFYLDLGRRHIGPYRMGADLVESSPPGGRYYQSHLEAPEWVGWPDSRLSASAATWSLPFVWEFDTKTMFVGGELVNPRVIDNKLRCRSGEYDFTDKKPMRALHESDPRAKELTLITPERWTMAEPNNKRPTAHDQCDTCKWARRRWFSDAQDTLLCNFEQYSADLVPEEREGNAQRISKLLWTVRACQETNVMELRGYTHCAPRCRTNKPQDCKLFSLAERRSEAFELFFHEFVKEETMKAKGRFNEDMGRLEKAAAEERDDEARQRKMTQLEAWRAAAAVEQEELELWCEQLTRLLQPNEHPPIQFEYHQIGCSELPGDPFFGPGSSEDVRRKRTRLRFKDAAQVDAARIRRELAAQQQRRERGEPLLPYLQVSPQPKARARGLEAADASLEAQGEGADTPNGNGSGNGNGNGNGGDTGMGAGNTGLDLDMLERVRAKDAAQLSRLRLSDTAVVLETRFSQSPVLALPRAAPDLLTPALDLERRARARQPLRSACSSRTTCAAAGSDGAFPDGALPRVHHHHTEADRLAARELAEAGTPPRWKA